MPETGSIVMGARVPRQLHARLIVEQRRIAKLTGIEPSLNEIVRMLLEKGLEASGRKRHG
jgi:hypothetical protein